MGKTAQNNLNDYYKEERKAVEKEEQLRKKIDDAIEQRGNEVTDIFERIFPEEVNKYTDFFAKLIRDLIEEEVKLGNKSALSQFHKFYSPSALYSRFKGEKPELKTDDELRVITRNFVLKQYTSHTTGKWPVRFTDGMSSIEDGYDYEGRKINKINKINSGGKRRRGRRVTKKTRKGRRKTYKKRRTRTR